MTIQDLMTNIVINGDLATEVPDDIAQMFLENSGAVATEDEAELETVQFAPEEATETYESDYSDYSKKYHSEKNKCKCDKCKCDRCKCNNNDCGSENRWHDCGSDKQLIRKSIQECEYYRVCKRKVYEPPMKVTNCYPQKKECCCQNPCCCKNH